MSIIQFLRILWARKWIVVATAFSCVIGALIVVMVVPPRWQAHSRVMLDLIKPDPLTGEVIGVNARPYAATQIELVKDYEVAGQVADQLGWLSDPALIDSYQHRSASDQRDFRRWIAQQVIDRTDAELVEGSNILEITYSATTPNDAKAVADALMKAYIDTSVAIRRQGAARDAEWFDVQAQKAKDALDGAAAAEATYEKQTGLMLQDDKTDVDTARLRALAGVAGSSTPVFAPMGGGGSPAGAELAQVDAAISQASQTLGPNHPQLVALRAKRAALVVQAAQERSFDRASAGAAASAASAGVGAVNQAMAAEKSKIVGQADKIEKLKELHAEVDLRRDEYNKTASKAADLRQEATIGETGLTVLGSAVTPQHPVFPNKPLILGGSLSLGLAMGVLVGLLLELFGRRVRGAEDSQVNQRARARNRADDPGAGGNWDSRSSRAQTSATMGSTQGGASMTVETQPIRGQAAGAFAVGIGAPHSLDPSLVMLNDPTSATAEAVRALRTHLMAQHVSEGRRAVAVCAASGGVGCSFIAANLGVSFSQIGVKTLFIDADLRHPSGDGLFGHSGPHTGLAQCLADSDESFGQNIQGDVQPNLSVMFAGGTPANPQELLAGDRFTELMDFCLREYDVTVVDTPPANTCSDARRISTVTGYSLIVARRNLTYVEDVRALAAQLEADHARVIGTVMNDA